MLSSPVFAGAVALLLVNDWVLKAAYGTSWTGKLSDLAGVVLLAWLLGVLTGYAARSALVVALAFAGLKTVPGVAEAAAPLLGGVTLRDPTDLLVLPVLIPVAQHLRSQLAGSSAGPSARSRVVRLAVAASTCGLAALAVGATSCASDNGVRSVRVVDGTVWASVATYEPLSDTATRSPSAVPLVSDFTGGARSVDGGRTWMRADPVSTSVGPATDEACSATLGCFRVVAHDRVEHKATGAQTWATTYSFSAEDKRRLELRNRPCSGKAAEVNLSGVAIAAVAGGEHVVVGAGSQGVLHREPGGGWERREVLGCAPTSLHGPSQLVWLQAAPLALALSSVALIVIALTRGQRAWSLLPFSIALVGAVVLGIAWLILVFIAVDYLVLGPLLAVISLILFGLSLVLALDRRLGASRPKRRSRFVR